MHCQEQEIQRPVQVYNEMYDSVETKDSTSKFHSMGLGATLVMAFFVMTGIAFLLHHSEVALTRAFYGEQSEERTLMSEGEQIKEGLDFSTIAHKLLGVEVAHAVASRGYEAKRVKISQTKLNMEPGAERDVFIRFQNIGSQNWTADGANYISLYTYSPKYRESDFFSSEWFSKIQPAKIDQDLIGTKGVATMKMHLKAPQTPGTYREVFQLAAENRAWIPGGLIELEIIVNDPNKVQPVKITSPPKKVETKTESKAEATSAEDEPSEVVNHKALLMIKSHRNLKIKGGEIVTYKVGFKNTGDTTWSSREVRDLSTVIAVKTDAQYAHSSWLGPGKILKLSSGVVNPGQLEFYSFKFKAPTKKGEYNAKFYLYVSGNKVEGGEITIPITVTSDAPLFVTPIKFNGQEQLGDEPIIRVGLFKLEGEGVVIKSTYEYEVFSGDRKNKKLGVLKKNTAAILNYSKGKYSIEAPGLTLVQKDFIRLVPKSDDAYFTITSFEDRPKWNTSLNYNAFRGVLEIRHSEKNSKTWLINELPIEQYILGVAETTNYSESEYQKALMTAARTYAFHHLTSGTKHKDRHFHVDAKYDQVYKGYNREQRFDKVAASIKATRGELVTYKGDVVITPYYSHSDGRTRAWTEVWGGATKPWLVSVKAEYDDGRALWGHGVGMSALDANKRAKEENLNYKE